MLQTAFTGCDTVSAFATRGKKTAWETWKAFEVATEAFIALSRAPKHIPDEVISIIERFTILLYDRTSSQLDVNLARLELFTKKGKGMEQIPPTKDALVQHLKRAVYQGGHCWGQALEVAPEMPSPTDWGWMNPHDWRPLWSILPQASQSLLELLSCGCRKGCHGHCKCKKASLKCTALCQCGGGCEGDHEE